MSDLFAIQGLAEQQKRIEMLENRIDRLIAIVQALQKNVLEHECEFIAMQATKGKGGAQ